MFEYTPLEPQQIRILTLQPGIFESEITVNLCPVTLNTNELPIYEALSYTWGSPHLTCHVLVDSEHDRRMLSITENLHTALRHLRHPKQPRDIWADAVCINQSDVRERNQQVARMADIYEAAMKVLVWLGPEADGSTMAIENLVTLASKIKVDWTHYTITAARVGDGGSEWLDLERHAPFDDETWVSIVQLLNRPWFTRLWIWQEVFLAVKGAEVVCGFTSMTWEDFRKAILCLWRRRKPDRIQRLHGTLSRAWQISNMNDQPSLRTVLRRTKDAQCSDQRDRIYGVLNLVKEQERLGIQPDYGKSVYEVFRDLMTVSIFEYGDLTLLTCCELQDERNSMPSWVPNWSTSRKSKEIWGARACWNSLPQAKYNDGEAFLTVTGYHADVIIKSKEILTATSSTLAAPERVPRLRETYGALKGLTKWLRNEIPDGFDEKSEAICRTLCCNEFSDRYEPLNTKHLDFQRTLKRFLVLSDPEEESSDENLKEEESAMLLDAFYVNSVSRSFIITKEERVGLAPNTSNPGDCIAVLLGCQSPIVLRSQNNADFRVLGECYVHGLMTGEAFFGPLPDNWQRVARYDESTLSNWDAFIDREKGAWQFQDPRMGPLPDGWVEEEHSMQNIYARFRNVKEGWASIYDPRMMLGDLRARGITLQDFTLV
ncbi:MAG: hypothetical protein Q9223_004347 [Gallowayella weberi]